MTTRNFLGTGSVAATSTSNTGAFLAGISCKFSSMVWLDAYRYFRADTGQSSSAQKFAAWQVIGSSAVLSNLVRAPACDALSGALSVGWNEGIAPTAGAQALSQSVEYQFATGFDGNFVLNQNQFTSGGAYAAGITAGPGFAFSDTGGSAADPFSNPQGWFGTTTDDPTASPAYEGFNSSNFGIDVTFSDVYPGGPVQLWPNQPHPVNSANDTADNFTLGTEVWLSSSYPAYQLAAIGYYSPPGVTQLATECGIWAISGQSLVTATHQSSPSWSGAAGSGWVWTTYSGVTVPNGKYKITVFNGAATPAVWNAATLGYWQGIGPGAAGLQAGPVSAPNNATSTGGGQSTYHQGPVFSWPDTYSGASSSPTYWVDAIWIPVPASGAALQSAAALLP